MEQWFQWCEFEVVLYDNYVEGQLVLFTVYVNGMLMIETPSSIDIVVADLRPLFAIKDLERVSYLLNIQVKYKPGVIMCLSQTAYIDRMCGNLE